MSTSAADTTIQQALLSVTLAALLVTAGCAGFLSDEGSTGPETPTSTATLGQQENSTSSTDGTDLRSASVPENGSVSFSGELDSGDPTEGGKYYEPIQVTAVEGQVVNITMRAEGNRRPALRFVYPDGNVTRTIANETGNLTGTLRDEFSQTGRYTIEATSVEQNATFDYTLTIERSELPERDLFEGDLSEWNQTEQYLEFTRDFGVAATGSASEYGSFPDSVSDIRSGKITVNESGDYAVYTYEIDPDLNFTLTNRVDVVFQLAYASLDETYRNDFANDSTAAEDETWVPEIIFFRGINEETGELYRTTFLTREWAREWSRSDKTKDDSDIYAGWYYSTLRYGPAVQTDDPGDSVTEAEFPQIYWNYTYPNSNTTLAERYGL